MAWTGQDESGEGRGTLAKVIAYAFYAVGIFALLSVATHSDPIHLSTDRVIATDNAMMIFASAAVVAAMVFTLHARIGWRWHRADPLDLTLMGFGLEGFGWIVHRGYWLVWRTARNWDYWVLAENMERASAGLITGVAFIFIMLGFVLVLNIPARRLFGGAWFFGSVTCLAGLWVLTYQMISWGNLLFGADF